MDKILIIIPIHEFNENVQHLLERALNSVPNKSHVALSMTNQLYTDYKDSINDVFNKFSKEKELTFISSIEESNKNDFCTLVNGAVNSDYEWFTILEFDDEYEARLFTNFQHELMYKTDVSVFLSINEILDFNTNKFISYGNEAPWASSFSNEIGYVDNDCLQQFFDFYLTGAIFNTQDWINVGGLKSSMKLSFWYEFLLRLTHNNKKIYVIPKLGYKHYVNRENSLYALYSQTIEQEEANWWYDLAKKEYLFAEDRNQQYNNNNTDNN